MDIRGLFAQICRAKNSVRALETLKAQTSRTQKDFRETSARKTLRRGIGVGVKGVAGSDAIVAQ